jgi:hypothetical protein
MMIGMEVLPLLILYCIMVFNRIDKDNLQEKIHHHTIKMVTVSWLLVMLVSLLVTLKIDLTPKSYDLDSLLSVFKESSYSTKLAQRELQKKYLPGSIFPTKVDKNKTVDIIPYDISMLYAYDWKWKPRPVIQSYTAYTNYLDNLDSDFFASQDAPDQLIYSFKTIDTRYPLFDEPSTFRALLDHYQFNSMDDAKEYALFTKVPQPSKQDMVFIKKEEGKLGNEIYIPVEKNAHVFMVADVQLTWFGKLANTIYKIPPMFVTFKVNQKYSQGFRYIRVTGANGLFVSKYVHNLNDLVTVFEKNYYPDMQAVKFDVPGVYGLSWLFYEPKFDVSFYKIEWQNAK